MSAAEVARLSPHQVAELLGQQDLVLLDVRGMDFFLGYIPGSRRAPFELREMEIGRLTSEFVGSGKTLVFVCNTGENYSKNYAADLRERLAAASGTGLPTCQVFVLEGGFRGWQQLFAGDRYVTRSSCFPGAPHAVLPSATRTPTMDSICASVASADSCPSAKRGDRDREKLATWSCETLPTSADLDDEDAQDAACAPDADKDFIDKALCGRPASRSAPPTSTGPSADEWRRKARAGDVIWTRTSSNAWRQCLIIWRRDDTVKVQYFMGGKCLMKNLPIGSEEIQLERPV